MSAWPFGTSRKERKRIAALEEAVKALEAEVKSIRGPGTYRGYGGYNYTPSLTDLAKTTESLQKTDDEIISAAGLERMVVAPRTYIAKKKGNK